LHVTIVGSAIATLSIQISAIEYLTPNLGTRNTVLPLVHSSAVETLWPMEGGRCIMG